MRGRVEGRKDVAGKERQAEREVGAGEDGEGLDEDVGDGLVAGEVRVELVAVGAPSVAATQDGDTKLMRADGVQIELIIMLQWAE